MVAFGPFLPIKTQRFSQILAKNYVSAVTFDNLLSFLSQFIYSFFLFSESSGSDGVKSLHSALLVIKKIQ